ncbi:MAG: hypothetical protein HOQ09_05910 [Gemmatimonadaceae bacterium]|nr:hypothetical protein [Gemmatimonadaceae bacterium]
MSIRRLARLAAVAALASVAIACSPATNVVPGPAMPARDTVVISDSPYAAYVGAPVRLAARVWRDGSVDPHAAIEWSVSPRFAARIAGDGTLVPLDDGHLTIVARSGAVRTKRTLLVRRSATRVAVAGQRVPGSTAGALVP